MEIHKITKGDPLWEKVISFASKCSWTAGQYLAKRMEKNAFLDWERVFAAVIDEHVIAFAVFSEKDDLPERYEQTPYIALVFVDEAHRGKRISEKLIAAIKCYAVKLGYQTVYLKSEHRGLYEKYGFTKLFEFTPIHGPADQLFKIDLS